MPLPNEAEYFKMLGRLKDVMDFASEELEFLTSAMRREVISKAAAADIASRLDNLRARITFVVGNDPSNPVPEGLPSLNDLDRSQEVPF